MDDATALKICRARLRESLKARLRVAEQAALIAHLSRELQRVRDDLESMNTRYYAGDLEIRRIAAIHYIPAAVVRAKFREWLTTQDFSALKADYAAMRAATTGERA